MGEVLAAQFVAEARERRDLELLSLSLRALAWAHRARLDIRSARRLLDESVRCARQVEAPAAEGLALVSRAIVLQEIGRVATAARDLDAALLTTRRITDDEEAAGRILDGVRFQRAVIDQNAGRLAEAEEGYTDLLGRVGVEESLAAKALNNLALIQSQRGRHRAAERSAVEALRRAVSLGPVVQAPLTVSRAWIAAQAGRLAESLRYFDDAAVLYERGGLSLAEHYAEYADAMTDLRLLPEAAAAAEKAVAGFEAAGAPLLGAEVQLRLARIAMLRGDYARAESAAMTAVETLRRQRRTGWRDRALVVAVESRLELGGAGGQELLMARRAAVRLERRGDLPAAVEAHLVAGRIALRSGRPRSALTPLARAAELSRGGPVLLRIRGRLAAAIAARSQGDDAATLRECRAGIRDLASHRSSLPTMELRALASGHGAELGEVGLDAVVRQGQPSRILQWMERTRAAALLALAPTPIEGLRELRDAHRASAEEQERENGTGPARGRAPSPAAAEQERRVRTASWSAPVEPSPASGAPETVTGLAELRRLLDGRVLVEFGQMGHRLVAMVVGARRSRLIDVTEASVVAEHLRALFFSLRRLANPKGAAAADAARRSADLRVSRLREVLLDPLGLDPGRELVVVPVGLLHGVPWSALHDGPVALAPSATFWARTRRAADSRASSVAGPGADASRTVLVAGPELIGANEEVEALRAVHERARVLGPQQSLADDVLEALRSAELGHLACHGWLRTDNPMFSALVLADGPVTVQELHTRGIAPHRLVLASCHSGADVSYVGNEVIGFVSAMLAQGTAGVVASIAAIPDVAAVDLMVALHRGLARGETMARALHAARQEIDRESPEGYVNWCTFSAHGAA